MYKCSIYETRPEGCKKFPISIKDAAEFKPCSYLFDKNGNRSGECNRCGECCLIIFCKYLSKIQRSTGMIIVTGLPRSGTSMMMRILKGLNLEVTGEEFFDQKDEKRSERAKYLNPEGFYEIRGLVANGRFKKPEDYKGKVVKVVVPGILNTPVEHIEKVIFCLRNPSEIIESQRKLIGNVEVATTDGVKFSPELLKRSFDSYKRSMSMMVFLATQEFWDKTYIAVYEDVVMKYDEELEKISSFLGIPNTKKNVMKDGLYRSKAVLELDEFTSELYNAIKEKNFSNIKDKAKKYLQDAISESVQWVDESEFQTYVMSNLSLHKSMLTNNKGLRDKLLESSKKSKHYFDCQYYTRKTNELYTIKRPGYPDLTRLKVNCKHYKENKTLEFCHQCFMRNCMRNIK
jgi:hypothetical protein